MSANHHSKKGHAMHPHDHPLTPTRHRAHTPTKPTADNCHVDAVIFFKMPVLQRVDIIAIWGPSYTSFFLNQSINQSIVYFLYRNF